MICAVQLVSGDCKSPSSVSPSGHALRHTHGYHSCATASKFLSVFVCHLWVTMKVRMVPSNDAMSNSFQLLGHRAPRRHCTKVQRHLLSETVVLSLCHWRLCAWLKSVVESASASPTQNTKLFSSFSDSPLHRLLSARSRCAAVQLNVLFNEVRPIQAPGNLIRLTHPNHR